MAFTQELRQATTTVSNEMDRVWRKSVAKAFNEVIEGTPVDKGDARRSWLMGDNNDGSIGQQELTVTPQMAPVIGKSTLLYSNLS